MTKIAIIQGHPDGAHPHFCHALADAYREGAEGTGHEVRLIDIGKLDVPTLRSREEWRSGEGPAFAAQAREIIGWCEHLVLIYPLWMGTLPAHLKAFIEHVFTEDFAFLITEHGWESRLKGRSARVVVTMGMPAAAYRYFFFAHSLKSLRRNILGFSGFSPIRDSVIGMVEAENPKQREHWLQKMRDFGGKAS
jgi:putative NADPH-quinone reductase